MLSLVLSWKDGSDLAWHQWQLSIRGLVLFQVPESRLKVAAIYTSLVSAALDDQGLLWGTHMVWLWGIITKGMVMCLSNKCCLAKVRVKQFSKIVRTTRINSAVRGFVLTSYLTLPMPQWNLHEENGPKHDRVKCLHLQREDYCYSTHPLRNIKNSATPNLCSLLVCWIIWINL